MAKIYFTICELKEVVRQKDKSMINALSSIRFGEKKDLIFLKNLITELPFPMMLLFYVEQTRLQMKLTKQL